MCSIVRSRPLWTPARMFRRMLRLPRMGSFTSAPKILNEDTQDGDVDLPPRMSRDELMQHCHQQLGNLPPLVKRSFRRLQGQSGDTPDGVRVLQWNVLSRVCGEAVSSPCHVRVLQWNVLSQALGQMNDNFVCCPDEALEWRSRRYHIIEEIVEYCPDVICLQEVDHFNFLKTVLGTQGYRGAFFPKPDSPCLYIKGNNGPDGCAIFFKEDKFELLKVETRVLEVWRVQSNQVAVVMLLRIRETSQEICVATTHLKARTGALLSTLRNEQGKDLLDFVTSHYGGRPVIICGDFNAEPTEPVYLTLLSHQSLRMASAYATTGDVSDAAPREPPYTTWKIREEGEVCHTIDYVFYSLDSFSVEAVLDFPTGEEIGEGRVPSFGYPSDHFSLVCDFRLKSACELGS
ncbi:Nocturnin [Cryptotermes secundus]|uniref:Nocturnin n=1 Tax=Cryptotermes secundus TaxID=105785 RepID=A0A2J7PW46_9NEOP|nr:nocturnin isoform X3 [Cryptotermes secundus]PNF20554.1 Nocturnin [Cryptotermes secundus]PNF20558.1 Nocturnin [Cryptotermes secundus]